MTIIPQTPGKSSLPTARRKSRLPGDQAAHIAQVGRVVRLWDHVIACHTKAGKPLSERVIESADEFAFLFEFTDGDESVFGCYKRDEAAAFDTRVPDYALTVRREPGGGQVVCSCNGEDARCRRRLCKHQVWLAIMGGYALHLPGAGPHSGVVRPASTLDNAVRRVILDTDTALTAAGETLPSERAH
ncbi:MAG: hypothetical protein JO250_09290 [Armatimonadetes bacterium]|nr:hypothetical protein [Armatimonadota bacterium]